MKAIILAGGEGRRLRPLSFNVPKPMIPLFDRPLLEHIVLLLKSCGFTELCMTLHYLPEVIRRRFGDGSGYGVRIEYRVETEAAGTAGSLRACADFIGGEDFLVIGGDAACDYDLRVAMEKHRISGADATLLLARCRTPGEYGLVLTSEDGQIRGFVEKPGPERICSELVNTGIYVLSPSVLAEIPADRSCDFGGELFPRLLKERRRLLSWEAEGYWNDVGTCRAYMQTCRDVLDGRLRLRLPEAGIRTAGRAWISPEAAVSPDVQPGPYTVIGAGSRIGGGCRIVGSVLHGAAVGSGCEITGSILSPGAVLGKNTILREGCVLGEGVRIDAGSLLRENVRIWPGVTLGENSLISESLTENGSVWEPAFLEGGTLAGSAGGEITPRRLLQMGRSISNGRAGAAAAGGAYARLLADAFLIGVGTVGSRGFRLDASLPAAAAAAGPVYGLDTVLFVLQQGSRVFLRFFDEAGLPIDRKRQRALAAAAVDDCSAELPEDSRSPMTLTGSDEIWMADALRAGGSLRGLRLSCNSRILQEAFGRSGAEIAAPAEGVLHLELSDDGFGFSAVDEKGRRHSRDRLLCALTQAEFLGGAQAVALPYEAPSLAEELAAEAAGTVYRLERDGEDARRLYRHAPWCRDGLTAALRLMFLLQTKQAFPSLAAFMDTLPDYHTRESVVRVRSDDAAILHRFSRLQDAETVSGVRFRDGETTATIRRLGPGMLQLITESLRMEAAEEFQASLRDMITAWDEGAAESKG